MIMYDTNINEEISKRTGKVVASINDAKSAGLCEFEIGNAKESKSAAFLMALFLNIVINGASYSKIGEGNLNYNLKFRM